jgi:hypothetical protein
MAGALLVYSKCNKHISAATDTDIIIDDTVFSMQSLLWLNDEDQLDKPVGQMPVRGWSGRLVVVSCKSAVAVHGWLSEISIVSSHYLPTTSD